MRSCSYVIKIYIYIIIPISFIFINDHTYAFYDVKKKIINIPTNNHDYIKKEWLNEILILINDQLITLDEVNSEYLKLKFEDIMFNNIYIEYSKKNILEKIINNRLIFNNYFIKIKNNHIKNVIYDLCIINNISIKELKKELTKFNLTPYHLYQIIKNKLIINNIIEKIIAENFFIKPIEIEQCLINSFYKEHNYYFINNIVIPYNINKTINLKNIICNNSSNVTWKIFKDIPNIYKNKIIHLKKYQRNALLFIYKNDIHIIELLDMKTNHKELLVKDNTLQTIKKILNEKYINVLNDWIMSLKENNYIKIINNSY